MRSCFLSTFIELTVSGYRGGVENVTANQRPVAILFLFVFSIEPKNTNFDRGLWDLASFQLSLNFVQRFQRRRRKCLSQSEAMWPSFLSARKSQTWLIVLRSCFLSSSLNSFQWFQRRSRKCEKLTTTDDWRTTDNALSAQVHSEIIINLRVYVHVCFKKIHIVWVLNIWTPPLSYTQSWSFCTLAIV